MLSQEHLFRPNLLFVFRHIYNSEIFFQLSIDDKSKVPFFETSDPEAETASVKPVT